MDKNMITSQADRRKHPRITIELEYHLFLGDKEYSGKTANISLSGAFLSRPEPELIPSCISQSADLKIKFNDELLSFKCEIIYVATQGDKFFPIGAGVVFCDTDDETSRSILNLDFAQ